MMQHNIIVMEQTQKRELAMGNFGQQKLYCVWHKYHSGMSWGMHPENQSSSEIVINNYSI